MKTQNKSHSLRASLLMPRSILVISLFIFILIVFFIRLGHVSESAAQEYAELLAEAESSHSTIQGTPYTAKQERQKIQKEMFFQRAGQRLQIGLTAKDAQLVLDHQDAHTYIVEHMQQVKCLMQEELYYLLPDGREAILQNGKLLLRSSDEKEESSWLAIDTPGIKPMTMIRCIDAQVAEYHYKDDRFVAYDVKITRYATPGHDLNINSPQTKMLMKGKAEQVEFSLKGKDKDLNFKAYHLKATFFDMNGIRV